MSYINRYLDHYKTFDHKDPYEEEEDAHDDIVRHDDDIVRHDDDSRSDTTDCEGE